MSALFIRFLAFASVVVASAADSTTATGNHTDPGPDVKVEVRQFHMGMIVRLTVWAPDTDTGRRACRAAFEQIGRLDRDIFSDYQPASELRRLSRAEPGRPIPVSPALYAVLETACRLAAQTGGRYDPTAKPVIDLWRQARRERRLPDPEALREALARVGYQRLHLNPDGPAVTLASPGLALDLGAIAKGYIADAALAVLRDHGLPHAMVEAGGDMVLGAAPPGHAGWPVSTLTHPKPLVLAHSAISTSGDTSQFLEIDGIRYSHVVDARTGQALTHRRACVVIAPAGMLSDALATAGTLLPPEEFQALLQKAYPGARGWIVTPEDTPSTTPFENPFASPP